MQKFAVIALIGMFTLGACGLLPTQNPPAPVIIEGTATSSLTPLSSSPTPVPPTETFAFPPFESATPVPTDTPSGLTATVVSAADLTATFVVTATDLPANLIAPTATFTLPAPSGSFTPSPTLGIRTYGTLPPANTPYTTVTLINTAKREAYISLQVVTDQGYTIIEYPVKTIVKVKIPTGNYTYVAWVGGVQFVGYFHVSNNDEPIITLFKDKVIVK